jgi:hypothetical protein
MSSRFLSLHAPAAVALLIAAALFSAHACFGQAFTANLTGVVTDATGGAIPAVTVTLKNTATNDVRQTQTGAEGRYTFSQLPPATYELSAELKGFKTFVQKEIILRANQSGEVSFSMQIGEVTESVEVAGSSNWTRKPPTRRSH